jgi:hypothetical protein
VPRVRFKLSTGEELSKRTSSLEEAQQVARDFVNKQGPIFAGEWIEVNENVFVAREAVVSVTVISDETLAG